MKETLTLLHTQQIQTENARRIRATRRWLAAWLALTAALLVAVLIWRNPVSMDKTRELPAQLAATAVTILFGGGYLFLRGMKLSPLLCYRRYLREISHGLSHEEEGAVVRFSQQAAFRDGLDFYQLVVNVGDPKDEKDERILYWDASLPRPELAAGERVRVLVHGNELLALGRAG